MTEESAGASSSCFLSFDPQPRTFFDLISHDAFVDNLVVRSIKSANNVDSLYKCDELDTTSELMVKITASVSTSHRHLLVSFNPHQGLQN